MSNKNNKPIYDYRPGRHGGISNDPINTSNLWHARTSTQSRQRISEIPTHNNPKYTNISCGVKTTGSNGHSVIHYHKYKPKKSH